MVQEWRHGETSYRIENIRAFSNIDGVFEPMGDLRHETEKDRRGWDGPFHGSDDGAGVDDVRISVALFRSAQVLGSSDGFCSSTHTHQFAMKDIRYVHRTMESSPD